MTTPTREELAAQEWHEAPKDEPPRYKPLALREGLTVYVERYDETNRPLGIVIDGIDSKDRPIELRLTNSASALAKVLLPFAPGPRTIRRPSVVATDAWTDVSMQFNDMLLQKRTDREIVAALDTLFDTWGKRVDDARR